MTTQTRQRLKLLGVIMVFVGPLALAYLLYYGLSYGGPGTNGGTLIDPAMRVPDVMLTDSEGAQTPSGQLLEQKWTILQVAPGGCDTACETSLKETRQIRALLHRRATRVQRVLLTDAQPLPAMPEQPDLSLYRAPLEDFRDLFESQDAMTPGTVYLIDPLGNWMLYYPPGGDGSALFKDVKHLLKLSHIG
ncbi:hypothetical protein T5B8_04508 [Salinisphaera sp. T5B8]|uniref:hypothetical protein n=1 Tax=Salinisphaera sp. T5B8 TaxID=1304154 RepID=UPI0033402A0A